MNDFKDKHLIVRIGPFQRKTELKYHYVIAPGDYEYPMFRSENDENAFKNILKHYPASELTAEPLLAKIAKENNIEVQPYNDNARQAVGWEALRMYKSSPINEMNRKWTILPYLKCAQILENLVDKKSPEMVRFELKYVADLEFLAFAYLAIKDGLPNRLQIFNSLEEREQEIEAHKNNTYELINIPNIQVLFRKDDKVILEALNRAYSLESIPVPVIRTDEARTVEDLEVMILTVAMDAVSQLIIGEKEQPQSYFVVEDLKLGAYSQLSKDRL
jgi:hypothetical protein